MSVTDRPCGLQGFPKSQIRSQTHPLSTSPTFTMEPRLTMMLPGPVRECRAREGTRAEKTRRLFRPPRSEGLLTQAGCV